MQPGDRRPFWGNPFLWLGISALTIVLGLYVAPQFFGATFLFLPFVWVGRARRG